jgi:hypothetical protein
VLETVLWSDPNLFTRPQTVTASATGGARAVVRVDPATQLGPDTGPTLSLRVVPRADGRCVVRLAVTPTAVPSAVDPSSEDDRELGIHVGPLSYTPDR